MTVFELGILFLFIFIYLLYMNDLSCLQSHQKRESAFITDGCKRAIIWLLGIMLIKHSFPLLPLFLVLIKTLSGLHICGFNNCNLCHFKYNSIGIFFFFCYRKFPLVFCVFIALKKKKLKKKPQKS